MWPANHFGLMSSGGDKAMSYWSAPLEALEDPELLAAWAGKGVDAAARAKVKPKRKT